MMELSETRVWRETSVCMAESVVEERERGAPARQKSPWPPISESRAMSRDETGNRQKEQKPKKQDRFAYSTFIDNI